jgi:hypothetical protein
MFFFVLFFSRHWDEVTPYFFPFNRPTTTTTMDKKYRASKGGKIIGYYSSMTSAMKALPKSLLKTTDGYVEVYDPENIIMPSKSAEEDGWKLMRHRVCGNKYGGNGWYWND